MLSSFKNQNDAKVLEYGLDAVVKCECDTWDYQWGFYRTLHGGIGIVPKVNLISNIGFGLDATHTTNNDTRIENLKTIPIKFPLQHPCFVLNNELFDKEYNLLFQKKEINTKKNIISRFLLKIKKWD